MPVPETLFEKWSDLLKPEMLKLLPLMKPRLSLDGDLRTHFKDERVRLGSNFQSKYLGMNPFRWPTLFSILSFLDYEHGVFHPFGGCDAVTAAMARIAKEMGIEVLTEEPVEKVLIDNGVSEDVRGKAKRVRTSKRQLRADAVVVNADFEEAMRKLVPGNHRHKWSDKKIAQDLVLFNVHDRSGH